MKYIASYSLAATMALAGTLLLPPSCLRAQETNPEPAGRMSSPTAQDISPELMRSFLHLQEQVHSTQMAVERTRLEAEAATARNTEALNARLQIIERALDQAHKENSTAVQETSRQIRESNQETSRQIRESNHQMMLFAGVFATIGFLALALTGWLQWKTASRLNTSPSQVGLSTLLPSQNYGALGFGQASTQPPNVRLRDALGRLEHRIADLEVGHHETTLSDDLTTDEVSGNPGTNPSIAGSLVGGEIASLIKEGERLLAHEDAEKAIAHFDAVLSKHPGHPEVLLHKGAALERVQRDQEAIECYDQAIRADKTLTMAYLHKGGLYNRMEKFNEAMECYEQALKVQEGRTSIG